MSEGWINQQCPKCGRYLVLVSADNTWRWKCPFCDIEKFGEWCSEWYSTNTTKKVNDEREF